MTNSNKNEHNNEVVIIVDKFNEKYNNLSNKISKLINLFVDVIKTSEELKNMSESHTMKPLRIGSVFKIKVLHNTLVVAYNQICKSFQSSQIRFTMNKDLIRNINQRDAMFD